MQALAAFIAKFTDWWVWLTTFRADNFSSCSRNSKLNSIHYMHDKYCYERLQMAFHDRDVYRTLACGMAGLSVVRSTRQRAQY